jgi:hypothetical protein
MKTKKPTIYEAKNLTVVKEVPHKITKYDLIKKRVIKY